jgi:hypothetical protein
LMSFAVTPQGLYYILIADPGDKESIQYLNFATNSTAPVISLVRRARDGMTISPDGHTLLYVEMAQSNADIMLVENFH